MICFACLKSEYREVTLTRTEAGTEFNVEAMKCPACGDVIFTHDQSLKLDKKRKLILLKESLKKYYS